MPSTAIALPNFFIVGAPKAGTTSLYHYLDQHPDIYMSPVKEPNYFASEVRPENFSEAFRRQIRREMDTLQRYLRGPMQEKRFGGLVVDWEDYLKLFANVRSEKAIGEASVCYLWSRTAAANICSRIPDAKIIMILRDPAERAFSQYLHVLNMGLVRKSFREEVRASICHKEQKYNVLHPFLEFGLYYEQVRRYLDVFPRRNVSIYIFEEYLKQPRQMLTGILRFLDVDSGTVPGTSTKHLEARVPRFISAGFFLRKYGIWQGVRALSPQGLRDVFRKLAYQRHRSLALNKPDRQYLIDYYREDVKKLADLLERDLGTWLV